MTRYTVVWSKSALDELVDDRHLADAPLTKGVELREGLRAFFAPPLRVLYSVRDDDRVAEVLRVKTL